MGCMVAVWDSMLNIHKPAEQESFKKPPWQVVSRPISQLVVHGNIQEHVPACRLVFPFHIFCCDLIELKNIVWGLLMVGFLCTTLGNGVRPRSGVSANHFYCVFFRWFSKHWNMPRICLCFSTMYLGTGNLDGLGVFGTAVCAAALFSISPQGQHLAA